METDVRNAVPFAKTVVKGIQEQNVPFMAASIAYQAFISLIPLLVLLFFVVSILGDEALAASVAETTEGFLPESGQELLEGSIEGSVATTGASVIGLVTLVWGSLKIFRGLDTAFSEIYATTAENSIVSQVRDGLIVLAALSAALVAAAAASAVFALFPGIPFIGLLNPVLLVVGLTIAFLPMYYFFPDTDVSVRNVLPGVVFAAAGWAALQALFQVYVAFAGQSDSAGAVGAILLLLTWLYFGGMVLLIGAVVNAASSGHLPLEEESEETGERAVVQAERERDRTEQRYEELDREYGMLRNDLDAQRSRRYELEDAKTRLEREKARLERENERLRERVERQDDPEWQRLLKRLFDRVETVNIATVRNPRK